MNDKQNRIPLLVIAGPTASGKTGLSIRLAKALDGEVISADSMQIYRGMTIGTAKPTPEEQEGVAHHLIDILEPEENFSVAQYAQLARAAIEEVAERGRVPILAGGTGLYISAVVDNISFSPAVTDEGLRQELRCKAQQEGNGAVWEMLHQIDPQTAEAIHENNLGRVIRAIEVYHTTGITMSEQVRLSRLRPSPYDICFIGLNYADRQVLYNRIGIRVDQMLRDGLLEEAKEVLSRRLSATAAQAIGYKDLKEYFAGQCSLEEAAEKIKQETRRYAKRQLTWFRRDGRIVWILCDDAGSGDGVFARAMDIIGPWATSIHREAQK